MLDSSSYSDGKSLEIPDKGVSALKIRKPIMLTAFQKKRRPTLASIVASTIAGAEAKAIEESLLERKLTRRATLQKVEEEPEEGIFIFDKESGLCSCQIPLDEEDYNIKRQRNFAHSQPINNAWSFSKPKQFDSLDNNLSSKSHFQQTGLIRQMTNSLNHWIDNKEGYSFASKVKIYDGRSLYLFYHKRHFRRVLVGIAESKIFDAVILSLIVLNSLCLVLYDYRDRCNKEFRNTMLEFVMNITTYCFMGEAVIKIVAQGFVVHRNSYLRDSWNCLDFFVVITSIVELVDFGIQLKGLRVLRVFKPLRSINQFPALKRLIRSLGHSISHLLQALSFMSMVFLLFSILGVKRFNGAFYQRCRTSTTPIDGVWPYDHTIQRLCSKDVNAGFQCPIGQICGTPLDHNLTVESDKPHSQALINYGITTFDNLLLGFIVIFQMISLEGWVNLMNLLQDAGHYWVSLVFCVVLVIVCSFFLLRVILAFLAESIEFTDNDNTPEVKKNEEIVNSLLRARKGKPKIIQNEGNQTTMVAEQHSEMGLKEDSWLPDESGFTSDVFTTEKIKEKAPKEKSIPEHNACQNKDKWDPKFVIHDDPEACYKKMMADQKSERIKYQQTLPGHAQTNQFFLKAYLLAKHNYFNLAFILITITNTVTLAWFHRMLPPETKQFLNGAERSFLFCFTCEFFVKLSGLGFKEYMRDNFNILEALLVLLGVVEEAFQLAQFDLNSGAFSALRALRLLRVFRLARSWKKLQELIARLESSIKEIGTFSILLLISIVIFLLLGRELFAYQIQFQTEDLLLPQPGVEDRGFSPRANFDNPFQGFVTIFIVIVGDDWTDIMYDHYRVMYTTPGENPYVSVIFFMILYIFGNLVLLNLFLAILLANFDLSKDQEKEKEELDDADYEKSIKSYMKCWIWLRIKIAAICPCLFLPPDAEDNAETVPSISIQNLNERIELFALSQSSEKSRSNEFNLVVPIPNNSESNQQLSVEDAPLPPIQVKMGSDKTEGGKSVMMSKMQAIFQKKIAQVAKSQKEQLTVTETLIKMRQSKTAKTRSLEEIALNKLKSACKTSLASMKLNDLERSNFKSQRRSEVKLKGSSIFCFKRGSPLRRRLAEVANHIWFDRVILLLIILSTTVLIFDTPLVDHQSSYVKVLHIIDYCITVAYFAEAVLKIVISGFLFNGKDSYMREFWNAVDFAVVILSFGAYFNIGNNGFLKVVRLRRVLKPLSLIKRNLGMRTVIQSLANFLPDILNLLLIASTILLMFSILGTTFYSGLFWHCHLDNVSDKQVLSLVTKWDCLDAGGEWVNADANFDNIFQGMLTVFEIITTEGWKKIMWRAVDSTDVDLMPVAGNQPAHQIFFVVFMIIGSLFTLNLFVGVVISNFNIEKEKLFRKHVLTPLQIEYCEVLTKCYRAEPKPIYVSQGNRLNDFLYTVVDHRAFEPIISVSIMFNTITMGFTWYDEPQALTHTMEWVNFFFTCVFTTEATLKIAVHSRAYFNDRWSIFDFIIVVASWVDFTVSSISGQSSGSALSVFRAFRVARLLRLIKRFKSLWKIFSTFVNQLPQLANVAGLLMLLLLTYSVVGVSMFATVRLQENLDHHANFQNFGIAMLTLFRCTTGESWNNLMHDAGRKRSILFQCIDSDNTPTGCGNSFSTLFFSSFMLVVSIIFLNMFIAIILEGFDDWHDEEQHRVKQDAIDSFIRDWQEFDPMATGFITVDDLVKLIVKMVHQETESGKPYINFNMHRDPKLVLFADMYNVEQKSLDDILVKKALDRYMNRFIGMLEIPTYKKMSVYNFHDTIAAMVKYVFTVSHVQAFEERNKRIQRQKDARLIDFLIKYDHMNEKTIAFYLLKTTEKEIYLEVSSDNFQEVIDRLEGKSLTEDEAIVKLEQMRRLRQKTGKQSLKMLDRFGDNVFDSSMVMGAKVIKRYLRLWQERKQKIKLIKVPSISSLCTEIEKTISDISSLQSVNESSKGEKHLLEVQSNYSQKSQPIERTTNIDIKEEKLTLEISDYADHQIKLLHPRSLKQIHIMESIDTSKGAKSETVIIDFGKGDKDQFTIVSEQKENGNLSEPVVNVDTSINMSQFYLKNRSQDSEESEQVKQDNIAISKIIYGNSYPVDMPQVFTHKITRKPVNRFKKQQQLFIPNFDKEFMINMETAKYASQDDGSGGRRADSIEDIGYNSIWIRPNETASKRRVDSLESVAHKSVYETIVQRKKSKRRRESSEGAIHYNSIQMMQPVATTTHHRRLQTITPFHGSNSRVKSTNSVFLQCDSSAQFPKTQSFQKILRVQSSYGQPKYSNILKQWNKSVYDRKPSASIRQKSRRIQLQTLSPQRQPYLNIVPPTDQLGRKFSGARISK